MLLWLLTSIALGSACPVPEFIWPPPGGTLAPGDPIVTLDPDIRVVSGGEDLLGTVRIWDKDALLFAWWGDLPLGPIRVMAGDRVLSVATVEADQEDLPEGVHWGVVPGTSCLRLVTSPATTSLIRAGHLYGAGQIRLPPKADALALLAEVSVWRDGAWEPLPPEDGVGCAYAPRAPSLWGWVLIYFAMRRKVVTLFDPRPLVDEAHCAR